MAMMKRIKIRPDIDSSELLESIPFSSPSEEETAMNACGSLLAQVISRDETPRLIFISFLR